MEQSYSSPTGQPPRPKNWLVESILVTIFCCLPFGIVGIINAASVNSRYDAGDYQGSLHASEQAGRWTKIGLFVGLGSIVLSFVLSMLGVFGGFMGALGN